MELKDEVNEVRQEVNEMSFAMEMIQFAKTQTEKTNKRLVIIIIIILVLWGGTIGGFFYYVTHYGYEDTIETSQEVDDIDTIENSYIINGGNYNAKGDTLTSLKYMLESMEDFVKMLKSEANSQEEMQLIREYTKKISEM